MKYKYLVEQCKPLERLTIFSFSVFMIAMIRTKCTGVKKKVYKIHVFFCTKCSYAFCMDFDEDFKKAINKYIEPLGRGGQARICEKTGIESTVISSIVNGVRTASELNKHIIANALGYTYDEFLSFGRGEPSPPKGNLKRIDDYLTAADVRYPEAKKYLDQIFRSKHEDVKEAIFGNLKVFSGTVSERDEPPKKRSTPGKSSGVPGSR